MEGALANSSTKRCAVVTGSNKGIGLEICRQLAANDIFVILTARDEKRGIKAVESLRKSGVTDIVYHQLDVLDSSTIASLADFIRADFKKLDILVNNAADGGLIIDGDALTALQDRFDNASDVHPDLLKEVMKQTYGKAEQCLKTNYYGTKSVTERLLPLLQLSNSPTIVNVTSDYGLLRCIPGEKVKEEFNNIKSLTEEHVDELIQSFLKDFKEDKLKDNGWPITVSAYKVSKLAVNAYTRMLARKFPNMRINAVHPGHVKTDITCNIGLLTPEEGAKGPVMVALLPENGPSGHFFDQMNMSTFE